MECDYRCIGLIILLGGFLAIGSYIWIGILWYWWKDRGKKKAFEYCGGPEKDIHHLDFDDDGLACED